MADLSQTAANVNRVSGRTRAGVAGDTITAGMPVYEDLADSNHFKPADADASEAASKAAGIALGGGSDGQEIIVQFSGEIDPGATATEGVVYVVSATAGGIAPVADLTTGDYVCILGIGNSNGNIDMDIQFNGAQTQ